MRASCLDLVRFMSNRYERAVEIGIGRCPDVMGVLKSTGMQVFATDIAPVDQPGLDICFDDVTGPNFPLYEGIEAVYSIYPPPELLPYIRRLARALKADMIVKPLTSDHMQGPQIGKGRGTFFFWSDP